MTILLTGFSAFPGAPQNPTEALVRSLVSMRTASGESIETLVLPVEWDGTWPRLAGEIGRLRPRAVVLFGLHAGAERIRIELTAQNARELGRVDAAGAFPSGPAVTDGPEALEARLPLGAIVSGLRAEGIDFELSRNAGRYLCNDSFYRLCRHADDLGVEAYGFVHTPLTDEAALVAAAEGALPDLCRTVPTESLLRAALAIAGALSGGTV